jgi:hypothetical protein
MTGLQGKRYFSQKGTCFTVISDFFEKDVAMGLRVDKLSL